MVFDATSWSWTSDDSDQDEAADLSSLLDSSRSGQTSLDCCHSCFPTFNGMCSSLSTDSVESELLGLRCNLLRSYDTFDDGECQQNSRCTTFDAKSSPRTDEALALSFSFRSSELSDSDDNRTAGVEAAGLLRCTSKSREIIDDNDHNNTTRQTDRRLTPVAAEPEAAEAAIRGMVDRRPSRLPRPVQSPPVIRPPASSRCSRASIRKPPKTVIHGELPPLIRPSQNGHNAYTRRPFIAVNRRHLRPERGNTSNSAAVRQHPVEVLTQGRTAKTAPNGGDDAGKYPRLPPVAPRRTQVAPKDTKTKFASVKLPSVHHVVSDAGAARRPRQRRPNRDVIELRALEPSMTSGQPVRDMHTRRAELLKRHGRLPPLKPA